MRRMTVGTAWAVVVAALSLGTAARFCGAGGGATGTADAAAARGPSPPMFVAATV